VASVQELSARNVDFDDVIELFARRISNHAKLVLS